MKITWDTMQGGRVELGAGTLEVSRGALVEDIPAADLSDPYVLLRAMELALNTSGQFAPGTGGRAILSGLVVTPAAGTDQARIAATFTAPQSDPGSGGQALRWVVEDDSSLASEHTELDPLGEPLHCKYNPPNAGPAAAIPAGGFPGGVNVSIGEGIAYPFSLNPLRPRRVLSIHGYIIGRPAGAVLDADGCLNDRPWPTGSLFKDDPPKRMGCWLCSEVSAGVERPGILPKILPTQLTRVAARFTTRGKLLDDKGRFAGDKDWSDWGVHHNIMGRIPQDMVTPGEVAKVKKLMAAAYEVGQNHTINGYTRVGMHGICNFKQAFGF